MYQTITTLTDAQAVQLHELYQHEWWSKGRTLADTQTMLANSDYLFGICDPNSERLLAFARVLSDRTYRAIIFDVIVAAEYRQQGLGTDLIEQILSHPELSKVELIQLFCLPEMIPFYQKFGFSQAEVSLMARRQQEPG
jgi:predicted GNAT family N-acyltransferase